MATPPQHPVTQLLAAANRGEAGALDRLWSLIYDELRRLAQHQMGAEAPGHTLQPTALVHEAFFRLFQSQAADFDNRGHFFTSAARAMRQIRIDDARKRKRIKRGGGNSAVRLESEPPVFDQDPAEVLAVDEALEKLEAEAPRKAEVVMLRYFAGMTEEETASALGISRSTVQSDWRLARAFLHRELSAGGTRIDLEP